jgi:hypothetical protein
MGILLADLLRITTCLWKSGGQSPWFSFGISVPNGSVTAEFSGWNQTGQIDFNG